MKIKLHNIVVFAEDYNKLVKWYQEVFDLDILHQDAGDYHYTELGFEGKNIVGITPANEMEHKPTTPRNNTTILQLNVTDIKSLFIKAEKNGAKILFGPSREENAQFYYGGFNDVEGNQIWLFDESN